MPPPAPSPRTSAIVPAPLLVACLCAEWCGVCKEYAPLFGQLEADFAQARFVWVDIEEQADLVDPVEVENFPTILIANRGQARFFGTVTPHIETLRRLIQSHAQDESATTTTPDVQALVQRLTWHIQGQGDKK